MDIIRHVLRLIMRPLLICAHRLNVGMTNVRSRVGLASGGLRRLEQFNQLPAAIRDRMFYSTLVQAQSFDILWPVVSVIAETS